MVLVVHRCLSGSPLSVGIGARRVSGKDLGHVPEEQIWVVDQRLSVESVIVHHNGARVAETSAKTTENEVSDPGIGEPASHVEVLNGKLSNEQETEEAAYLSASCVVGPVKVGAVNWASNNSV